MKKLGVFVGIFFVVFVLCLLVIPLVSATWYNPVTWFRDEAPADGAQKFAQPTRCNNNLVSKGDTPDWVTQLKDFPLLGNVLYNFFEGGTLDYYVLKMMFFVVLFCLVFGSLSFVKFPSSFILRVLSSFMITFFSLFTVNPSELLSFLLSYQSVGATIIIFFPMAVLSFLTYVVASAGGNPFGFLLQRLAWLIYGVYIFVKGLSNLVHSVSLANIAAGGAPGFATFLNTLTSFMPRVGCIDGVYPFLFTILGIGVLYIFVYRNEALTLWLSHQVMRAEIEAKKNAMQRGMGVLEAAGDQTKTRK